MIGALRHSVLFLLLIACGPANAVVVRDQAFGSDGVAHVAGFDGYAWDAAHLAVATDQGVVAAVSGTRESTHYLVFAKLRTDGSLDTTFGGGLQQVPLGDSSQPLLLSRLLPLPDGGLLVVLQRLTQPGSADAVLLRFDAAGKPLAAFNGGQPLTIALPTWSGLWTAHAHGDGYLLASAPTIGPLNGNNENPARRQPRFFRVTDAGQLDSGFGQAGYHEEPAQDGLFGDAIVLPDRRFQVLHSLRQVNGHIVNRWRRYLPDGRVDSSGGTGGWIDVGDDGRRQLVNAFALQPGRYAVVDEPQTFQGYVDGEGRMTTPASFLSHVYTVVPFGNDRALVGFNIRFGGVPTGGDGAYVVALDAAGNPDRSFALPGEANWLRASAWINRYNVAADSPSSLIVADYNQYDGFRVVRYRELRGADQWLPIPAASTTALLSLAAIIIAASLRHRYRTTRRIGSRPFSGRDRTIALIAH